MNILLLYIGKRWVTQSALIMYTCLPCHMNHPLVIIDEKKKQERAEESACKCVLKHWWTVFTSRYFAHCFTFFHSSRLIANSRRASLLNGWTTTTVARNLTSLCWSKMKMSRNNRKNLFLFSLTINLRHVWTDGHVKTTFLPERQRSLVSITPSNGYVLRAFMISAYQCSVATYFFKIFIFKYNLNFLKILSDISD